ncbi:hypothetical protein GJAV_G00057840 [Gymnothorax javanicus]|nr:hypothetical protein GJAV_G00057840 [Gymnothorax javanicus]
MLKNWFVSTVAAEPQSTKTPFTIFLALFLPGFVLVPDSPCSVHPNIHSRCSESSCAESSKPSRTLCACSRFSVLCPSQYPFKMFGKFLCGIVKAVTDIGPEMFVPSDPPQPRRPLAYAEQHENDEERQFRKVFQQLAGDDMEISPNELMNILNRIICKHGDLKTDGFSIESCRSMVAVMDSDSTGKLGFHEFKYLWNNIKKWQGVYKQHDADRSGVISADELPKAFKAAGFPLNDQLFQMIIRRYSDENGNMDFDNYVGCLVRLDAMCRAFKTLDKDKNGSIKVNIQEWLQLTMYS